MKRSKTLRFGEGFRIAFGNARSQAAEMTIPPGDAEGGPGNRHAGTDQWLFVVEGRGVAVVAGRRIPLRRHTLVLIERGVEHTVRNTGDEPLRTLNVYVPPGYRADGTTRASGRPRGAKRAPD